MATNAIDYLKNSTIFSQDKYAWIRPLMDCVIDGSISDDKIESFVNKLYELKPVPETGIIGKASISSSVQIIPSKANIKISKIISIENIENIGLIALKSPITFKDGLNVIYGKNSAGKSSLFVALKSALGISSNVCTNLYCDKKEYLSCVKVLTDAPKEIDLTCKSGTVEYSTDVRLFDSQISSTLVEKDQVNQFELAHLKSEYFSYLIQLYDKISRRLETIKQHYDSQKVISVEAIKKVLSNFDLTESQITEAYLDKISFRKKIRICYHRWNQIWKH